MMDPADIVCINPEGIRPVHEARDPRISKKLIPSMKRSGWLGRPLLVVPLDDGTLQALTGSHRIAAALQAGLETVPVLIVEGPQADLIRESRHFPLYSQGVAQHLFEHDESWIGRYILMDDWTRNVERPWSKGHLEILRELGHEDMVEIMKVRKWPCGE